MDKCIIINTLCICWGCCLTMNNAFGNPNDCETDTSFFDSPAHKEENDKEQASVSPIDATAQRALPSRDEQFRLDWGIDHTVLNTILHAPIYLYRYYIIYKEFAYSGFYFRLLAHCLVLHTIVIALCLFSRRTIISLSGALLSAVLTTIFILYTGGLHDERITQYKNYIQNYRHNDE